MEALKAQVDAVDARVPDQGPSAWLTRIYTGLYNDLQELLRQQMQQEVQQLLDARLKEYRRDSSSTFVVGQQAQTNWDIDQLKLSMTEMEEQLRKLRGGPPLPTGRGVGRGGMRTPQSGRQGSAAEVSFAEDPTVSVARERRPGTRPSLFAFGGGESENAMKSDDTSITWKQYLKASEVLDVQVYERRMSAVASRGGSECTSRSKAREGCTGQVQMV